MCGGSRSLGNVVICGRLRRALVGFVLFVEYGIKNGIEKNQNCLFTNKKSRVII